MKQFNLRIDDDTLMVIKRLSKERGIDSPTRYARMLIEKGLVVDHQMHQGYPQASGVEMDSLMAEMLAENTILLRTIYRSLFKNDSEYQASMDEIRQTAKALLEE